MIFLKLDWPVVLGGRLPVSVSFTVVIPVAVTTYNDPLWVTASKNSRSVPFKALNSPLKFNLTLPKFKVAIVIPFIHQLR